MGIPDFLPGTKLEALNARSKLQVIKPKVYLAPPSAKEKAHKAIKFE